MTYPLHHLKETAAITAQINPADCENCVRELVGVRTRGGRLFILGVGGSAANASHAVNDFRKILADPSVDAIFIATPNFWHTPAALLAMQAGRHVYVEKPGSQSPHEAGLIVGGSRR